MKNFHFGHGIFIALALFIAFLVTVFVKSLQMEHTLVAKDYYAGDLAYQKTYDKLKNAITYHKDFELAWNENQQRHFIKFSDSNLKKGKINMYRPSDSKLDFTIPFNSGSEVEINNMIKPGKWTITAEWMENEIVFQVTKEIVIGV